MNTNLRKKFYLFFQNFTEWSREEKEKFAEKRMEEMKLKNEKIKKRHAVSLVFLILFKDNCIENI